MVPRVTTPGRSFEGAGMYYLHDKEALTKERVEFTHAENIPTQDPDKALKWMAYSSIAANEAKEQNRTPGRRIQNSVWTVSLSWHPEQKPTKEEMVDAGRSWMKHRGLQEHQALMVSHNDEEHRHIHLIVNLVHPVTLKLNREAVSRSKIQSSQWAEEYERKNGKIYCEQRVENNAKRRKGEYVKHREPEAEFRAHVAQLYRQSDNGQAFKAALEQNGYRLAQGKRIVVIDRDGKTHSLSRQIEGVKAKDIRAKLAGVELPNVNEGRAQATSGQEGKSQQKKGQQQAQQQRKEAEYFDRDEQERRSQDRIDRTAIQHEKEVVRTGLLNRLQDRQHDDLGRFFDRNQRARQELAQRMEAQYGQDERKLRANIADIETKMQGASKAQLWLMKRTGVIPREAETDLQNMRASLATIEQRKAEMTGGLEKDIEAKRVELETRHADERAAVPNDFDPQSLDPLATSIRQQQSANSQAYLGAAAPAESGPSGGSASVTPGTAAPPGEARTAFTESASPDAGPDRGYGPSLG
jgi:hypothetical protein